MRISQYFLPILKEDPANAEVVSHRLMLRAGMIRQQSSGLYTWLPLGLKLIKRIEGIIREELNKVGAIEVMMPCIQPASLWQESGRYDSYGKEMLRIKDRHENDLLFAPTAEEAINDLFRNNIKSYKELPKVFYQMNWKFRDEIRPRFGVMRGREFYMKDAYSFDIDERSSKESYNKIFVTYIKILKRMGLTPIPVRADTGPIGGSLSHEFHIIADTGESDIFYDTGIEEEILANEPDVTKLKSLYAAADDVYNEEEALARKNGQLKQHKSIEVGHIFYYGTKYAEAMKITVMDATGKAIYPHGGCYGIGVSRLVAAIIEASHDDKGIIWPKAVSPFDLSLLNLHINDDQCSKICDQLYTTFSNLGLEVLYDDSKASPGYKFSTHELIGIPKTIIVGAKLAKEGRVELKDRKTNNITELDLDSALELIKKDL